MTGGGTRATDGIGEAGAFMRYELDDKLQEIVDMMTKGRRKVTLMMLTDTHMSAEELARAHEILGRLGLGAH